MKRNSLHPPVRTKLALSVAAAMALGAGFGPNAFAQEEERLEEITVTGSRIRNDDFNNPQPATVIGSELMQNLGIVNVGDMMAQLPSNVGNNTPTANPGGNFFNGSNIANLRGLNPFFGSRTLTLVDSRRHVPTNQGDGVDMNFIPSILIERMEVVTGGASASYGSGAIGGVQNILLDRDLEGGRVQLDWGQSGEGDGDDLHYGLAWGTQVGLNGQFVVGFEGQDMDGITSCYTARDWCARAATIATNQQYATTPDPQYNYVEGARQDDMSDAGMFPLLQMVFNEQGTAVRPWQAGIEPYDIGGEGRHIYQYTNLRSPVEREVLYLSYTHQINENLGFFIEGSGGSVDTMTPQGSLDANFVFLPADNYYRQQLGAADPCATFPGPCFLNKSFNEQANTFNETSTDLRRYTLGLDGRFGDSSWTWEAYYQYGESDRIQLVNDNRHLERFNYAVDAVADASGNPVCRVTRDGLPPGNVKDPRLAQGCVPLNLFGTAPIPADAFDYSFGFLHENTVVEQDMWEGIASGEIWQGFGAGPVFAAIGASYRAESIDNMAPEQLPDYERTDFIIQYGESFAGEVDVVEYFAELQIPFTDRLNLQVAARRSSYENTAGFGTGVEGQTFEYDITTWKLNGTWEATDWLSVRASQSKDIRAPNFRELYYGQDLQQGGPFGWCSNEWTGNVSQGFFTNTGDPCKFELRGGLDLTPEEADTTTIGVILTPQDWNVRFAADYFDITIEDAITPANSALVLEGCFDDRDPKFCSQITGVLLDPNDPVGGFSDIQVVRPTARNFRGYDASGFDLSADWLGEYDLGTISMRLIATRMLEQIIQPSETNPSLTRNIAGVVGSTNGFLADWSAAPDWSAQWITSFMRGPVTVTTQARWIKEGKIWADRIGPEDPGFSPNILNSVTTNRLPNYVIWALNASYSFNVAETEMEVFGSVNNLFDKEPPLSGTGVGGVSATFYDTIGRFYRVGLRASF